MPDWGTAGFDSDRGDAMSKMKNVKSGVKGVLNQKVRLGLFSVPLWVVGLVVVGKALRARRREQRYA
jgi:2-hydroxychromene-2-carboxylate isomerase